MAINTKPTTLRDLQAAVKGNVILPGDPGYNEARLVRFRTDARPAAVVRVADVDDIGTTVRFAADAGLELAIRSGGHSYVGFGTTQGGIVLDLGRMKGIQVDPGSRSAWAEAGLTTGEVGASTAPHGLIIGFGDTASVGIGGITTGGGSGYLVRRDGLTIDNLEAAEIVTADGELHQVDGGRDQDLFWAIRGGGGNFGVVSRFKYHLSPVASVFGGMLILPATPETLAGFVEAAGAAPDELSTIANVMPTMPMPQVPAEHHGRISILSTMAYTGDPGAGERAVAPFRALAEPWTDTLRPMRYSELFPPEPAPGDHPAPTIYARTLFLDRVDRDVAADILGRVETQVRVTGTVFAAVTLRVLGGAYARVPAAATAYAHRSSRIMASIAIAYQPDSEAPVHRGWVDSGVNGLRQEDRGAYVNFMADEGQAGVRAAYPGLTLDRLRGIKRRYDPTNLFHVNQNILPTE